MIMTVILSGWSLPRILLAFLQHQAEFCLCFHNHLSKNQLFHLSPPYLPIYGIYVPSLTKTFMYHLNTLFKSFLFVTVQAHGAVRRNQYLSCKKYLTEVLTSQMQKEKICTSPILDDGMKWAKCCYNCNGLCGGLPSSMLTTSGGKP